MLRKRLLTVGVVVAAALATVVPVFRTLAAHAATNTTVVLTFDDDRADQTTAASLLGSHGMLGTFYINSNTVGTSGHMTWPYIQALQASGDEIAGHTLDFPHENLTQVSNAEAIRQVCTDRTAIQSHGLTVTDFAYPFGAGWDSASVRSVVQNCGYSSARMAFGLSSSGPTYADTSPPADIWAIKTEPLPDNTFSLATLEAMVTSAENHGGGIVTIVFHEALTNMPAFLDWLQPRAANGTVTKTMTQAINNTTPPPPPPPPSGPYAPTVVGDSPAGYWRLDEASGTTAANSAAGGSPGTYQGVTLGAASLLPADSDKAASFNGTSSRVQSPSSTGLSPTAGISVEAWIKPTTLPPAGAFRSIASKAEAYSLQFNGPTLEFTIIQGSTRRRLQAPGAIAAGGTYHIVGTYDGTIQRLYVNGAQVASIGLSGAINANATAMYIGSWDGSTEFFTGTIDEVAVYPTALTAAKVANHYAAGTNAAPPSQKTLSVTKSGAGAGTVTSSPAGISCGSTCSASFNTGSSVTLTAAPASGSTFSGWTGGGCSGTGSCVVALNADTSVTAAFAPVPTSVLSVTKSGAGAGTVTSSPAGISCGSTCSASFNTGSSVTLTAAPASGSTFSGWTGGGCSGTGSCVVALNAATSVDAAFAVAPVSSYQQVVAGDNPVGFWRLDETSGTTAANAVAGGSPGTYQGVTLGVAGLLASATDKAASFSGTNSRVQIASTPALSPSASVSVEAWIKPAALPATGAFASIVSKAESYSLQFNGPKLEFTIIQGTTRRRLQAATGAIAVGGTYHVVGTYDGTTQRLYINGTLVASAALTGAINVNTTALYIGSWNGSTEFFRGTIDEPAVYAGALTAAQVANHRTAGTTP